MKLRSCIAWIALAAITACGAPDSRFDAARAAYDEGRYADALALYDELAREFPRAPEVHFNRGNTLARLGRTGEAIANFQRVLMLAPRDADARANLSFLRDAAGLPKPKTTMPDIFFGALSAREWKWMALAAWWLGASFLVAAMLAPRGSRVAARAGAAMLLAALLAGAGWGYWIFTYRHPPAVIITSGVQARFAPLPNAIPHFDAPEGLTVRVLEQSGGWLRVREERREGWIERDAVSILELDF